jgi:cell division protein FtsB
VIRRHGRSLIKRSGSRRTAPWFIVAVIAVGALVSGVLLEQVVLAQSAFKLQAIDGRLAQAETRQEELLTQVAELESPGRIERYARSYLGMVDPSTVEYIVARVRIGTDTRLADAMNAGDLPLPGGASAVGTSP